MILKRFQNNKPYIITKILSTIFLIILLFIFSNILNFLLDNPLNNHTQSIIILYIALIIISITYFYVMKTKTKNVLNNIKKENKIELYNTEKILINQTPCLIIGTSLTSKNILPRNITITNKRIVIGIINTASLIYKGRITEHEGVMNLWHKNIKEIPEPKNYIISKELTKFSKANTHIQDIALGQNGKDKFIIIKPKIIYPMFIKIYHPDSEKIYNYFKA